MGSGRLQFCALETWSVGHQKPGSGPRRGYWVRPWPSFLGAPENPDPALWKSRVLGSAPLGPRSSVSRWVLGVPCHEIRDTPGLPVRMSTSRCFPASSRFMGLLRQLYPGLAAARPWPVVGNAYGKGQQLPSAATPSRAGGGPPRPASEKRSQALTRPPDRFCGTAARASCASAGTAPCTPPSGRPGSAKTHTARRA